MDIHIKMNLVETMIHFLGAITQLASPLHSNVTICAAIMSVRIVEYEMAGIFILTTFTMSCTTMCVLW